LKYEERMKIVLKLILMPVGLSIFKILIQYFLFALGIHKYYSGYFTTDKFSWDLLIIELYFYGIFYFFIFIIYHLIVIKLEVYNRKLRFLLGFALLVLPFTVYIFKEYNFNASIENNIFLSNLITYFILGILTPIIYNSLIPPEKIKQ